MECFSRGQSLVAFGYDMRKEMIEMAMEKVRVTFYRNSSCGYYADKTLKFGGLEESFRQIEDWSAGLELSLTKLAEPVHGSEVLPTYLMDILRMGSEWMFALWIQTPDHEGTVASISMNSLVGRPVVHENTLEPMTLAGFPTFFWCSPKMGLFATIAFMGQKAGRFEMEKYVRDFLSTVSPYVVVEEQAGGEKIVGYKRPESADMESVTPRFTNKPIQNPGELDHIRSNQSEIRKVVRRARLHSSKAMDKDTLLSVIRFIRGKPQERLEKASTSVLVEVNYTPSARELESMIDAELSATHAAWEDMGFVLKGDGKIHWLTRARASDTFEFNIRRVDGVPTLQSVAHAFDEARNELLALVKV